MTRRKNRNQNRGVWRPQAGFTLLELLVVVAVIVLLVAVLLPGLRGARQAAYEVNCQSNLSQLAKAWQMYLDTSGGAFYQKVNANYTYGGWNSLTAAFSVPRPLNPFFRLPEMLDNETDAGIFRCPNDNGEVPNTPLTALRKFGTSYQTNLFLIGQNAARCPASYLVSLYDEINKRLIRMNVSRAADPTHLILIGDYGWVLQWQPEYPLKTEWHNRPAYHNAAFLDGHVEFLQIRKGLFITSAYRVQPFEDLDTLAISSQQEKP